MVDRTVVLETAGALIKAQEDIVEGLGPVADDWLKKYHGSNDFINKENQWRRDNLKGEEKDPLYSDLDGHIVWDFSALLNTLTSKGRWNHFLAYQRAHQRIIPNRQEIYLDIKRLVNLRDKSVAHRTLGEFTRDDYHEFFQKSERVLRTLGAIIQAEKFLQTLSVEKIIETDMKLTAENIRISNMYTSDEISERECNTLIAQISADLKQYGWRLDTMEQGMRTWGCTSPTFNRKLIVEKPFIHLRVLPERWLACEQRPENLRIYVLAEAKKSGGDFRNDKKIRIANDFAGNDLNYVEIQETDYLSSAMTDRLRWNRVRSKRVSASGFPAETLWDGVAEFIVVDPASQKSRLKGLADVAISNQLSASTLVFTNDGQLIIVLQNDNNLESVNLLAPSGSGSLDWSDLESSPSQDLLSLVRFGAERELREECSLDKHGKKHTRIDTKVMVTAFVRLLHRAGKPEFFCLGRINESSEKICELQPERYVQRALTATNVEPVDLRYNEPSREIRRVCADYLIKAFMDKQAKRIPLSYPLEHGLRLLMEACEDPVSAKVIDQFIQDDFR